MCSDCDELDNINPVVAAERELKRAKRADGYVQNGIKLLGKFAEEGVIAADWWNHVDLFELDMIDVNDCILGQLFGTVAEKAYLAKRKADSYACLKSGYDYAHDIIDELDESVIECGFSTIYGDDWDALKASWTYHVVELRNKS